MRHGDHLQNLGQVSFAIVALLETANDPSDRSAWKTAPYPNSKKPQETGSWAESQLLVKALDEHAPLLVQTQPLLAHWEDNTFPMSIMLDT